MTDEHHTTTDAGAVPASTDGQTTDGQPSGVVETGIESLDRKLDGGFPTGSIIAVAARPASQSELVLGEFIDGRTVSYLTVERHPDTITRYHDARNLAREEIAVHRLDGDEPLVEAHRIIDDLNEPTVIVIDPLRSLERQPESAFIEFYHALTEYVVEADSIAYLHCLVGPESTAHRELTMYLADGVILLETDTGSERVETTLCIPKLRGGEPLEEVIKLDLSGEVDVDVTRKIA